MVMRNLEVAGNFKIEIFFSGLEKSCQLLVTINHSGIKVFNLR